MERDSHPDVARERASKSRTQEMIDKYFVYEHLPAHLQGPTQVLKDALDYMEAHCPDGPEKTAGFRKVLEAKDCFVRAKL